MEDVTFMHTFFFSTLRISVFCCELITYDCFSEAEKGLILSLGETGQTPGRGLDRHLLGLFVDMSSPPTVPDKILCPVYNSLHQTVPLFTKGRWTILYTGLILALTLTGFQKELHNALSSS